MKIDDEKFTIWDNEREVAVASMEHEIARVCQAYNNEDRLKKLLGEASNAIAELLNAVEYDDGLIRKDEAYYASLAKKLEEASK
jgi:hypothetical protein